MDHITMKRDGGWRVELMIPVKFNGKDLDAIDIRPPEFDHVIRWGRREIASTLALMSELTGLPEAVLRSIRYPDLDRVMMAFTSVLPQAIRSDFEAGNRPITTPKEEMPYQQLDAEVDPVDPRFPAVPGPVQRFPTPPPGPEAAPQPATQMKRPNWQEPNTPVRRPTHPPTPVPKEDTGGLAAQPADIMKAVV